MVGNLNNSVSNNFNNNITITVTFTPKNFTCSILHNELLIGF